MGTTFSTESSVHVRRRHFAISRPGELSAAVAQLQPIDYHLTPNTRYSIVVQDRLAVPTTLAYPYRRHGQSQVTGRLRRILIPLHLVRRLFRLGYRRNPGQQLDGPVRRRRIRKRGQHVGTRRDISGQAISNAAAATPVGHTVRSDRWRGGTYRKREPKTATTGRPLPPIRQRIVLRVRRLGPPAQVTIYIYTTITIRKNCLGNIVSRPPTYVYRRKGACSCVFMAIARQ